MHHVHDTLKARTQVRERPTHEHQAPDGGMTGQAVVQPNARAAECEQVADPSASQNNLRSDYLKGYLVLLAPVFSDTIKESKSKYFS